MKRIAMYAGSFDPATNGHLDIVSRALNLFDEVLVAVAFNPDKLGASLFTPDERVDLLRRIFADQGDRVRVDAFHGLLVSEAKRRGVRVVVRGLRAVSDYEYELQMALMNRFLASELETVFLMASQGHSFISSRLVKEVWSLGGDIRALVPGLVYEAMNAKLKSAGAAAKPKAGKRGSG